MIEPRKRPAETPVEWLRFADENLEEAVAVVRRIRDLVRDRFASVGSSKR